MSGETNKNAVFKFGYPKPHPIFSKDTNKNPTADIFRRKIRKTAKIATFPRTSEKKRRADRPSLHVPAPISTCGNSAISLPLYRQSHRHGPRKVRQLPEYGDHCRNPWQRFVRQHCKPSHPTVQRLKQSLRRHRHGH